MTDEELLKLPGAPAYPDDVGKKVRRYEQDLRAALDECLSKYVAESCYDDAKKALEGAQDAFDGMAGLVEDLDIACRKLDDHAVVMYGQAFDALERFAPGWRDEIMIEHVEKLT